MIITNPPIESGAPWPRNANCTHLHPTSVSQVSVHVVVGLLVNFLARNQTGKVYLPVSHVVGATWVMNVAEKFTKLFRKVVISEDFLSLSHVDRTVFCYLMTEYDGNNNGSIRCGHKQLKNEYKFKSGPNSHQRAMQRLTESGLVFITRKGGKNLGPDLCALTMFNMDSPNKSETYKHPYNADIRPIRTHWDKPVGNGNPLHTMLSKTASNVATGSFGKR